jgi:arginase family enzyme
MSSSPSKGVLTAIVIGAVAVAGIVAYTQGDMSSRRAARVPAAPSSEALAAPAVAAKINALPADKQAFIKDPAQLARFNLTAEKVAIAIQDFDGPALDAFVTSLMESAANIPFREGQDVAETPLDSTATRFNSSTVLRPVELDAVKRAPGPFSVDRYLHQKSGIPTFARAPVAVRKADLEAGKVEVAFIGVPLDLSSGYRDTKHAPTFLRAVDGLTGVDPETGINPNLDLRLADYGNLAVDNWSAERTGEHVRVMVKEVASIGTVPFIVGGDQSLMYADVAGVADHYGKDTMRVVSINAHAETVVGDHLISDNQSVGRLMKDGIVAPRDVIMVALRDPKLTASQREQLERDGVTMFPMDTMSRRGWSRALDDVVAAAKSGNRNVYISFNISAVDPSFASGAGRPVAGGLTVRESRELVRALCSETKVVGFDMLDVAPVMDLTYKTSMHANSIMHACLAGIALRKR